MIGWSPCVDLNPICPCPPRDSNATKKRKCLRFVYKVTEFTIKPKVPSWKGVCDLIWAGHLDWKLLISTSTSSGIAILMNSVPGRVDGVIIWKEPSKEQLTLEWELLMELICRSMHKLSLISNSLIFLAGSDVFLLSLCCCCYLQINPSQLSVKQEK